MIYTRAGHDRPLLLRDGGVESLPGEGAFLGLLDAAELSLTEEEIDLRPGDRLVLYSDGLVDTFAPDGRRYGQRRLREILQAHGALPAIELRDAVFTELAHYRGGAEQYDDMTMLVVEVQGQSAP
jgi:serine phosphatase RsbU (regulator of sigma subunit)